MANEEHLHIFEQGVNAWNQWRTKNPDVKPDLSGVYIPGENYSEALLNGTNLNGAVLYSSDLSGASLKRASLRMVNLTGAKLHRANLEETVCIDSDLNGVDLSDADLEGAIFSYVNFSGADLNRAKIGLTIFSSTNLSEIKGLETISHTGPSAIGIDTIYNSKGEIPEVFLREAGVSDDFITYMRSLTIQPIQFYSCFISYSHRDEEFAKRLHSRMRDVHLRVWFAPEDIRGGEKLHEQIDRAIRVYDKLLIILSEHSLQSEWVMTEIRKARINEIESGRRKLFPIRLADFETIRKWECFDVDSGKDLAIEVREYFIPDFSNWKNHDAFESAFDRLIKDLRAEG